MKRSNKILVIAATLTILISANTIGVFALQSFTDVGENHWAKEYIEKMVDKKIIAGYPDATFRASENVDKLATMVMIYRTLNATNKLTGMDINSVVEKYNTVITQYNIPTWGQEAVAVGLEKKIIDTNDLKDFFKDDGTIEKATRTEVAVFLGKALNLYLKEELKNTIITFDFNDAEFISSDSAPYVNLLIKKGIVNGDENGNFNPDQPIVRAAVAKMFSGFYDVLSGIAVNINTESNTDTDVDIDDENVATKDGKIVLVLENEKNIVVSNDEGKNSLYKIENNTKIVIEGKVSSIKHLEVGESVTLYIDEDDKLVKVEADSDITSVEGTIDSIIDMYSYYLITVEDEDSNEKRILKANDDTIVFLDDEDAELEDLEQGDTVTLTIDGEIIDEITAESETRTYEGILESNIVFDETLTIKIRTYTQKIYELEVDDDVDVERNDKNRKLTDLYKGDIVTVKTENGKVVEIIATSVEVDGDDEGIITEIILGTEDKISIKNEDEEINTYVISSEVDIEIDDKDSTIYDLKPGYSVEVEIEDGLVTDIEAEEVETSDSMSGVITGIYKDFDAITVKVRSSGTTKYISVLADDADIISTSGKEKSFSYLDEGDEVFIYGSEDDEIFDFVAERIIILKKN